MRRYRTWKNPLLLGSHLLSTTHHDFIGSLITVRVKSSNVSLLLIINIVHLKFGGSSDRRSLALGGWVWSDQILLRKYHWDRLSCGWTAYLLDSLALRHSYPKYSISHVTQNNSFIVSSNTFIVITYATHTHTALEQSATSETLHW